MEILDGKKIAGLVQDEVKARVAEGAARGVPGLALVQVGEDPASSAYVKTKARMSEYCGIRSEYLHLPADVSEAALIATLRKLGEDASVHGILLQLPLPKHIDQDRAILTIPPEKDVDGFHPENAGLLASGSPRFVPCTPLGIREIFTRYNIETAGRHIVVIGRSIIVGKPFALLMMVKGKGGDATVTVCHSRTPDVGAISAHADIVVAALGRPHFLRADMVKEGAVVVDVGMNRVEDASAKKGYRLVGDVEFDAVAPRTSFITPVPGGVGPMTVAMLMSNTLKAHRAQTGFSDAAR